MSLTPVTLTVANPRHVLGVAAHGRTGTHVVQVTDVTALGTITVTGRVTDSGVASDAGVDLPYRKDGADVSAGTAISAVGIYHIPADGLDVILSYASGTSVTFVSRPIAGA